MRILPIALSVSVVALFGLGCNPMASVEKKIGEKVAEKAIESASGGKVKANLNEGGVSFKNNKTGEVMTYGENVKLPDGFPDDVPIYASTKIIAASMSPNDDKASSVTLMSEDDIAKVVAWYADKMKSGGWTEAQSFTAGGMETRSYEKGNATIALTVIPKGDEEKGCSITIVRTEKQEKK